MKDVRVRAAPSPTGRMHIGNLRTFVNNYLLVKSQDGKYILRIEDTDKKRYVEGGTDALIETLRLYGIEFDEGPHAGGDYGPYIQSERIKIYQEYAEKLVEKGKAYYCFCSEQRLKELREYQEANHLKPGYDRKCRDISLEESKKRIEEGESYVIRMKLPKKGKVVFKDELVGEISTDYKEFDDQVLIKSDGYPTYHFAVVIDDHLMKISHVIRGREYQTQTPKNIFLYESLGWETPKWVHAPLLLNPDGKGKLSKRHGAMSAVAYLRKGYLPEAVINYLALAGWAPPENQKNEDDIYTVEELTELFTVERMMKSNARYDQKKLDYINGKHIRGFSVEDLVKRVIRWAEDYVQADFITDKFDEPEDWVIELRGKIEKYLPMWKDDLEYFKKALVTEQDRIKYLSEIPDSLDFFYVDNLEWDEEDWRTKNHDLLELAEGLKGIKPRLAEIFKDGEYDHDRWEETVRGYADELGWKHGDLFMAIRSAVTGRLQSPPLLECIEVLGWEKAEGFIDDAIDWIDKV